MRLMPQIRGAGRQRYYRYLRLVSAGVALLILLWVGAMSPHLVHHLFEAGHEPVCLLFEQANSTPCLVVVQPCLVIPQTLHHKLPTLPTILQSAPCVTVGSPRAPPPIPA